MSRISNARRSPGAGTKNIEIIEKVSSSKDNNLAQRSPGSGLESLDEPIFLEDFNDFRRLKESVVRRKSWTSLAKNPEHS